MLSIIKWNVSPEIFTLFGSFSLKYYGLLFATGIALAYLLISRIYKQANIPEELFEKLAFYILVGTFIGMRLGHCLFYQPDYYLANPIEIFLPIEKVNGSYTFVGFLGLASHGGGIGIIIALILYCRKTKLNLLWVMDRVAIAVPLTGAFIRVGNFMNSEIIGKPTGGNYGVVFELVDNLPRHPAQLYEAIAYLFIFAILYFVFKKSDKPNGFILGLLFVLLFSARFVIEFFKEEQVAFEQGMSLNMGQLLSIPFIIGGILLIVFTKNIRKGKIT